MAIHEGVTGPAKPVQWTFQLTGTNGTRQSQGKQVEHIDQITIKSK